LDIPEKKFPYFLICNQKLLKMESDVFKEIRAMGLELGKISSLLEERLLGSEKPLEEVE